MRMAIRSNSGLETINPSSAAKRSRHRLLNVIPTQQKKKTRCPFPRSAGPPPPHSDRLGKTTGRCNADRSPIIPLPRILYQILVTKWLQSDTKTLSFCAAVRRAHCCVVRRTMLFFGRCDWNRAKRSHTHTPPYFRATGSFIDVQKTIWNSNFRNFRNFGSLKHCFSTNKL